MMTAKQLAEKAEYIARHCKSVYMWGVVCSPVTEHDDCKATRREG
nr:MAG TPA: hypothetical protein [Caudoviricetes sp.]